MSTQLLPDPIASTLFSKTRKAVFGLLYGHADETFYLRQIVDRTGLGIGQVQREVKQLSEAGIIRRETVGRHVYFQADPTCPIFDELRSIVTKTVGAAAVLRQALHSVRDRIVVAFIYGSVARAQEKHESDLDLMVIGDVTFSEVAEAIRDAEVQLRRAINPTVYPLREFRTKLTAGHQFLKTVV
jgi:predicted nucleotidyltransferase